MLNLIFHLIFATTLHIINYTHPTLPALPITTETETVTNPTKTYNTPGYKPRHMAEPITTNPDTWDTPHTMTPKGLKETNTHPTTEWTTIYEFQTGAHVSKAYNTRITEKINEILTTQPIKSIIRITHNPRYKSIPGAGIIQIAQTA